MTLRLIQDRRKKVSTGECASSTNNNWKILSPGARRGSNRDRPRHLTFLSTLVMKASRRFHNYISCSLTKSSRPACKRTWYKRDQIFDFWRTTRTVSKLSMFTKLRRRRGRIRLNRRQKIRLNTPPTKTTQSPLKRNYSTCLFLRFSLCSCAVAPRFRRPIFLWTSSMHRRIMSKIIIRINSR